MDEPGIVEQLPQILRSFGYRFAHVPSGDTYAIRFLDEHELIGLAHPRSLDYVIGDEFTSWQGLDGTQIPLYLSLPVNIEADYREIEIFDPGREDLYAAKRFFPGAPAVLWNDANRDLYRGGAIKMAIGDMAAVTEEWLDTRRQNVDFALLDRALAQRIEVCPPTSRARLYEYWSSAEGIRAEEQLRCTRSAEQALVRLSALNALASHLLNRPTEPLTPLWKRLLWTQHHDSYWAGGPELRDKCIRRLHVIEGEARDAGRAAAAAIAACVGPSGDGAHRLALYNTCPYPRRDVVHLDCVFQEGEAGGLGFPDLTAQILAAETFGDGSLKRCRLAVLAESEGLGYAVHPLTTDPVTAAADPCWELVDGFAYENGEYRVLIGPDGLFHSLYSKRADVELLDGASLKGNEVRYRHRTGEWLSSGAGPVVIHRASGPVADLLRIQSRVGDLPIETCICFYHDLARIDFEVEICFARTELGVFWDDASKMNVYWPLSFTGQIRHDVPFGVVEGREHRPLLATRWVDVSDSRAGLAYLNRGTVKHWIRDGVLANVWAWGADGNCFNNRNLPALFMKAFDLRLDGRHRIEYAVYPHGPFAGADVVRMGHAYAEPMMGLVVRTAAGTLAHEYLALGIDDPAVASTVVEATADGLRCRVYNTSDRDRPIPAVRASAPWSHVGFQGLDGDLQTNIGSHQIGWLSMR